MKWSILVLLLAGCSSIPQNGSLYTYSCDIKDSSGVYSNLSIDRETWYEAKTDAEDSRHRLVELGVVPKETWVTCTWMDDK